MLQLELGASPLTQDSTRQHGIRRTALVMGFAGALVGFAGSWIPSYWGDEAASVMSASRTWPSLAAVLRNIDGVHGLYYALLHVWVHEFGTSEVATRALSAVAVGFMVAGTVVLAHEFVGARIAVAAGVVCIVLPRTTFMAAETRSYALGAAAAVWVTVLVVVLLHRRTSSAVARRWWLAYAVAVAACIYVFLYLVLLLVVHGVFVALVHRRAGKQWARAAVLALALAAPILVVGYRQRTQIRFLQQRHYATAAHVLVAQWFGYPLLAVLGWLLVLVAIVWLVFALRRRVLSEAGRISATVLAGLWLGIPTAVLLIANATVAPVYNVRYLSFSTPAAAIMVALGISAAAELTARRGRQTAVALICAVVIASAPVYLGQRAPWAKDGGSDLRAVADYVRANATPGAAVVFDQATKPSRDPRLAIDLYPEAFGGLQDVALKTPFWNRGRLWDRTVPTAQAVALATRSADVWAIELTTAAAPPPDVVLLEDLGYEIESSQLIHRTTVYHLVKE